MTQQRLERDINQLKEMQAMLSSIDCSLKDLQAERDLLREENQRLQLEVARLKLDGRV
jgi:regulator of replication initiation timing